MTACAVVPFWEKTHEEWEETRRSMKGIGGSDVGTILSWNKYKSALTLWSEKTGRTHNDFTGNEATVMGQLLERPIAELYAKEYGVALVAWPVMLVHPVHQHLFANLDFLEVEPSDEFPAGEVTDWHHEEPPPGTLGIVECKTTGIASHGNAHAWEGDNIPPSYLAQGYHYGNVSSWHRVTYAALVAGEGLQIRHLRWDQTLADWILSEVLDFWDMIELDVPPDPDGTDDAELTLARLYPEHSPGKVYEGGPTLAAMWDEYEALKVAEANATKDRKALRSKIIAVIKDAEVAMSEGVPLFTFRSGKPVESLDADRLRALYPEIVKECTKTRPGSRAMRKA